MMGLKREMSSIKKVNISIGIVALESLGAGRQEEWIVLSPDREQRGFLRAEVVLKLRIEGHITGIVQEQVQLNFVIPRPRQQGRIERIGFRGNLLFVLHPVDVLRPG